jgi:hypothetical protein
MVLPRSFRFALCFIVLALLPGSIPAAPWNGYSMERFTAETPHFIIYYHKGIEHLVKPVGDKLEQLYTIYHEVYHVHLPNKTQILLQDGDESNGLTFANLNFIILWTHDFDFDLRGSHAWFDDVITHEFAHQCSIPLALKFPWWMYGIQFGYFTHPNEPVQLDLFQMLPPDILPPWFAEGIAQYSSSKYGADRWDSHREMMLRSLTLSHHLITWDHMQTFAGKGDDFEKAYNQGFSMVTYIADKYGYDKVVEMARTASSLTHFDFDGVITSVLGIPARQLYAEWKENLEKRYGAQKEALGTLVPGKKINKLGYENYWPRFSPDGKKVYFLSNGGADYGHKILWSCKLDTAVKKDKKIKPEMDVNGFYDIYGPGNRIAYCSPKSEKSELPPSRGGYRTLDLFTDKLPPEKEPFRLFPKKTERQITEQKGIFSAAFSPTGDRIVAAKRDYDRFFLAITDTLGKSYRIIYPNRDSSSRNIYFIYSVAWSPDGKTIAYSYFDKGYRKIGLYDTASRVSKQFLDMPCDIRDPYYSRDGKYLYYSSDKTGIFNIYRYGFETGTVSRVTNVLGSAYAPAVSPDGNRLVFASYDSAGYGIYLLDTIKSLGDTVIDSSIFARPPLPPIASADLLAPTHRPYSKLPTQFLMTPTALIEQLNTQSNNVYSGASAFKVGLTFNLMDPYSWLGQGTELDGLFLFVPYKNPINPDQGIIDIRQSFDFWLHGSTAILPITLSFDYSLLGIAGMDSSFDETNNQYNDITYNIRLQNLDILVSHYLEGSGGGMDAGENQLAFHLLTGINRYDVLEDISGPEANGGTGGGYFGYNLGNEMRVGAMATAMEQARDSRSSISPRGYAAKLQYNYWQLFSTNQDNPFSINSNGQPEENQYSFQYHELIAHIKYGMAAPVFGDLHFDLRGDAIDVVRKDTSAFPSFYLPVAWVPGYTFYYQNTVTQYSVVKNNGKNDTTGKSIEPNDTVLVTGPVVVNGAVSYRFPLSRPLIDKKIGILYLEKLYGCLNFSGGAGVSSFTQLADLNHWVFSYGPEVRLQGTIFSGIPLAVSLRWDRGFSKVYDQEQNAGDRVSLMVGFDFDDWGNVMLPDYSKPGLTAGF